MASAPPEGLPDPTWTAGRYFPRFPEPDTVYVFRVTNAMVDWWGAPTSLEWRITDAPETMDALTLVCMQENPVTIDLAARPESFHPASTHPLTTSLIRVKSNNTGNNVYGVDGVEDGSSVLV
jgi:hypothetical protein